MKRLSLFEFEDFPWLPKSIRSGVTRLLSVFHRMMGTSSVLADLLLDIRQTTPFEQIVDLGSGSGGAMPETVNKINAATPENPVTLILTDKYPDPETLAKYNDGPSPYIRYRATSMDAREMDKAPEGLKTMIASFHHMEPATARDILHAAARNKQPLFIYELAQNSIPTFLWWLLLPLSLCILFLMTWFMTPFIRPLTFKQILFTYLIPVIPLVYAWDGQASLVRTYTFKDLELLLEGHDAEGYTWVMKEARKKNGKSAGYYLLGYTEDEKAG
ncbi:hypothetical protein [Robertkochia flava]|uniref:hypothetical protein n=1 Tax=Robertkochia flava TaxID=3447986 RepID=UPI001CCAD258|nr:hypothetical protein [Robertkochia marina]